MTSVPHRLPAFLGVLTLLAGGSALHAKPAHKQALGNHFGPFLAKQLFDCRTCHLPEVPGADGAEADRPHNPFGARLKAVRKELQKAGKDSDIPARLDAVADADSDGDGAANLLELLTGHAPGDPADRPSMAERAAADKTFADYRKFRSAYPWRPFEVVRRPALPAVKNAGWVRNPIDHFIAAAHEEHGLTPRPEAPKAVLLRRVYLDLIGLPPTAEELRAFLADESPDAYERVVDRLLASARHGERWGRHWMDVWRYSDWAGWGQQVRDSQPHVWRWRDWIVESLNADKGYDRMILEMLAADELAPDDPDALRATGYLVRNYKLLSREKWMQDTVDHTAQAFLGVTLGCARCHDHMFDPISQQEYYQVRAVFEPHQVRTDRLPGQPDVKKDGLVRVYDAQPDAKTFLFIRGDDRTPAREPLPPGVPRVLGGSFPAPQPVSLPLFGHSPDKRPFVIADQLAALAAEVAQTRQALATARPAAVQTAAQLWGRDAWTLLAQAPVAAKALDAFALAELDAAQAAARHESLAATVRAEQIEDEGKSGTEAWKQAATQAQAAQRQALLCEARRKLFAAKRALAGPAATAAKRAAAVKAAAEAEQALAKAEEESRQPATTAYTKRTQTSYPATSTGRRLAFARWIATKDNPLTARVAMNHVWLRHFGQALAPSVFDFGRNGRPPSHPALLDWLAAEFMDRGWGMKALHRLMVTSATYRQASTPDATNAARDRDNVYRWRMPSRRAEAEVVRDCLFAVAGRLDATMGGPEIDHAEGLTRPRRSLYFRHAAEKQMEFLKIFDCAEVNECYQRKESVLPQQALALANSELTLHLSRSLARSLRERTGSDPSAFTAAAFEQVLTRPPTAAERDECVAFLTQQPRRYDDRKAREPGFDPEQRARENLIHVLMNHHDFVTVR